MKIRGLLDTGPAWLYRVSPAPRYPHMADEGGDEGAGDGTETEEDGEETEEEDEPEDPTAELARLKKALRKSNRDGAANRKKLRDLEAAQAKPADKEPAKEAGPDLVVVAEAKTALAAAGITSKVKLRKAVRLLDLEGMEADKYGEVSGLEDKIDELKEEWPELFPTKARKEKPAGTGPGRTKGADGTTGKEHAGMSATTAAMLKKAGFRVP